jgi:hypothetical protein
MKQNTQNGTYITTRILKLTKEYINIIIKYTVHTIKQQHTKHKTIYIMIQNRTRRIWKNVINQRAANYH